ncbi:MAG: MoxR family ATPase [Bdellovibrionales bacterium]|nr:MoxR family ATPase [Bdellovibrionales bacterium]
MKLVGRKSEQDQIENMLKSGRHVLLEGAVGVGKTTLALAVAEKMGRPVVRVDGDGRYTEQKLVGSFDPKLVLERGFVRESFIPGPLYQAMEEGEILLINELNRMPEMVQNVLLPALDEGKIQIPVLGELKAQPGFSVIATQNPREFVATSTLSEALLDRLEWIGIAPLTEGEEVEVVKAHLSGGVGTVPVEACVELVRLTRTHPKVKRGASVRAAIALAQILKAEKPGMLSEEHFFAVALSVLANRIELQTGKFSNRPYAELLNELMLELKALLKKKPVV